MMGVPTHPVTRDLDVPETTFTGPDLTTFLGLDALGLTAMGQHLTPGRAVIECRMPAGFEDPFCKACGPKASLVGRWPGGWPTYRWGGDPRSWWCACGAWPARTAAECGDRTRAGWPSRGRD